jgi:flagellar biosynthesis regulator FlaF
MLQLAERLEAIVEEMTDMALDALRRASSGDPDSAEAGEAMAFERRIVRARRALEKSIAVLSEAARNAGDDALDGGAA